MKKVKGFPSDGTASAVPDSAVAELRGAVMALARRMRTERGDGALPATKLLVLSRLGRHGPATPGRLAAAERLQPQSLTRTLADLAEQGLIVRTRSTGDRRQQTIAITDAGLAVLHADVADRDAWLAGALEQLNETEAGVLLLAAGLMRRLAEG
ncbi:MarR family winged helix-turn-helix transcriptional regulator [Streptomyces sp. WZ-12]|uniref:MarR family winged helix-turn-helix transcriptional regulator n=1 Tax=Streptomyces sp. WZ-12 TaxID=3030210 RepID=UPI0023811E0A|nr:MarR family transcriptional regulator [Streptomyces sp. WZ-12]